MFELEYTPLIWPFVVSLVITTVLGLYAYRRRHLPAVSIFGMLMLALSVWTFCYIMGLSSATLQGKIFWDSVKYFGSASAPVLWFVLALHLTKNDRWLTTPLQMVLWSFVIVTCFVVFTNDFHHWFWTKIYLVDGFPETQAEHGFFFWVYAAIVYSLILTSVVLFFQYYRATPALYRRQALLMALGGFVPLGGRIVEDFLKIDLFPKVDNVIVLFLLSGMLFALAIFRYGAFDIVHIAHDLVIQNIGVGIIVLDMAERVLELNLFAKGLMHVPALGSVLHEVLEGWPQFEIKPGAEHEIAIPAPSGERWFHVQSSQIRATNGEPAGYVVVLFDITARKQAEQQFAILARTDPLTGITNRRYFFELAEVEFARARRYGRPLAILMFDIDHFKNINDTYGHLVGDEVIKSVAAVCQQHIRTTDILARYGGEEFICWLDEGNPEDAYQTAERIRQIVAESRLVVDGHAIQLTISVGVACLYQGDSTLSELIDRADHALYASKTHGRNRVSLWGSLVTT